MGLLAVAGVNINRIHERGWLEKKWQLESLFKESSNFRQTSRFPQSNQFNLAVLF